MKTFLKVLTIWFIAAASFFLITVSASAETAPFLVADGNYTYTSGDGTGSLTFSSVNPTWATYTDGTSGCNWNPMYGGCDHQDDIIGDNWVYGTEISFGALTNTSGSPTVFGPASLSVYEITTGDVFFSATIDNLDTSQTWNSLSNITAGSAPASRYVDELLANGQGHGAISISFTPGSGGTETFTSTSSGSSGITLAASVAPEPVSTILFITGGATLALRRFRKRV